MADLHPYEDQAVLYLLDRLSADERREFEARLAESAELRALLRELEDGTVAMAMTAPSQRPPAQIWKRIEKIVAEERRPETITPSFWMNWWRYGWAAAAISVAGWLSHVVWLSRSANPANHAERVIVQPAPAAPDQRPIGIAGAERNAPPTPQNNANSDNAEVNGLRQQIADLSNQINQVSQSLGQHQALLLETNRFKIFQLVSATDGASTTNAAVSPALQRALFLAMARELGWAPNSEMSPAGNIPGKQREPAPAGTNQLGVDFVDLRPGSNTFANPLPLPKNETQFSNPPDPNLQTAATGGSVPGFMSGPNAVLAFDSSIVAAGTELEFWARSHSGGLMYPIGTTVLGNNTTVVTIPFSISSGTTLTVTTGTGFGASTVLGTFSPSPPGP